MSVTVRKPMTLEEFLAWEDRQELRYEFDGFAPVAMTGGTGAHAGIQMNIYLAMGNRIRGKPCRVFGSDFKIQVAGSIRYPDAFVTCEPVAPRATMATEPVVVFEVLSPSTSTVDVGAKNEEYRDTLSIQRYVILHQDRRQATVFERASDDWVGHIFIGEAILAMPEIGIELPLAELYDGVTFDPSEDASPG